MDVIQTLLLVNATIVMTNTTALLVIVYKIGKEVYKNAIQRH